MKPRAGVGAKTLSRRGRVSPSALRSPLQADHPRSRSARDVLRRSARIEAGLDAREPPRPLRPATRRPWSRCMLAPAPDSCSGSIPSSRRKRVPSGREAAALGAGALGDPFGLAGLSMGRCAEERSRVEQGSKPWRWSASKTPSVARLCRLSRYAAGPHAHSRRSASGRRGLRHTLRSLTTQSSSQDPGCRPWAGHMHIVLQKRNRCSSSDCGPEGRR